MKDLTMEFKKMEDFTGVYQISKTLQFELRPQGKTEEMLKKSDILKSDEKRAEDYPAVKNFLDEKHKEFLQRVLGKVDLDWGELAEKIRDFQADREDEKKFEDLKKCQKKYREELVGEFKKDESFSELTKDTPEKLFKRFADDSKTVEEVKTFSRFACYFRGYQENRKNIYSDKAQQTSAAYRAVNVNFSKFFNAIQCYETLKGESDLIAEIEKEIGSFSEKFSIRSYNHFLPQSGIDELNKRIGKINYCVNQYRQAHPEISAKKLPFIPTLFKQILSDQEASFSIGGFQSDDEVFAALKDFVENTIHGKFMNGSTSINSLQYYLKNISEEDDLFVNADSLEAISKKTTGRWETFQDARSLYAKKNIEGKKKRDKYCDQKIFSFKDIVSWISVSSEDGTTKPINFTVFWKENDELFKREESLRSKLMEVIGKQDQKSLKDRLEDVAVIKGYLDVVQALFHLLKPLQVGDDVGGDVNLIGILNELYHHFEKIIPLYNHIRNYITKKPEDSAKIKLMFNCTTLADGWDKNKEKANHAVILRDGNAYFLAIYAPGSRIDFSKISKSKSNQNFQKMIYKLIADPIKDLPNLMVIDGKTVRKTGRKDKKSGKNNELERLKETYLPTEINRIRKSASYTGKSFSKDDLKIYIDYYKQRLIEYKHEMTFHFKETPEYKSWLEFTNDVKFQAYSITFTEVSKSEIWKLVDAGKLFLFQIWNKDFSEKSTGTPNKFTLYWKALFEENLSDVVLKLNGKAELFWRKAVIERKITHKPGEKLVNRTIVTSMVGDRALRTAMPEQIHSEIYRMVNGKMAASDLSGDTKKFLEEHPRLDWKTGMPIQNALHRTVVKDVPFEMIKDSRYTVEKYQFHVPIRINFKSPEIDKKPKDFADKFNEKVLKYLRDNSDVKIIGLDRGERNLIYLVRMDQKGKIEEQKSLNLAGGVDYHSKLDQREKERDAARKSWTSIGKIKDLKNGYISQVVSEIARMMVDNNAIVVMEDLSKKFKQTRMKIEKQVYQKFEKALIDKLNYLTFKNVRDSRAPGGLLAGYQLTNTITSLDKVQQCGFIFYVPAEYTSKIDPATGFVNLFKMNDCTSAESIKTFFENFKSILYHKKEDAFAFQFDYKKFKNTLKVANGKWTVWSIKEAWRNERDKNSGKFTSVKYNPSKEIKDALKEVGKNPADGLDLRKILSETPADKANAQFFHKVLNAFKLTVALRHSSKDVDKIISPVRNAENECFDSSRQDSAMPENADANGAYHIALKGLYLLRNKISEDGKLGAVSTAEWLNFARARHSK